MIRRGWCKLERRSMLVNLKDGNAIRGVLLDGRGSVLQLASAKLLEAGADKPTAIDGTAAIDLSNVAWVQVLAPLEV